MSDKWKIILTVSAIYAAAMFVRVATVVWAVNHIAGRDVIRWDFWGLLSAGVLVDVFSQSRRGSKEEK